MFQQPRIYVLVLVCVCLSLCLVYFNYNVFDRKIETISQKEIEKPFPSSNAMNRTIDDKRDPCSGRYVYVHDLPSRFNEDMMKDCGSINKWFDMCKFNMNEGFGPALNVAEERRGDDDVFSGNGWYATNQFTLEVIFNTRMKQYECLTKDSSTADAIFVPFYAGYDASRYLWGHNVSTRDTASFDLIDWLQKRDEWKKMNGQDHFLVGGRPTWDFRRSTDEETDWGNKLLVLPGAKNMSMLIVESSPWNSNDFAIPFPTYFHPSKDADVFTWQARMMKMERKWLFCFAGVPRPGNPKSIRSLLINQCKNSRVGKHLECGAGEAKCHSPTSIMKMFQSSVFCLQPQGDANTRRSSFDSILAGCIPVFFHPTSFYIQYTWHIPSNYSKYSVFIPKDDIRRNVSIEQRLNQIDPNTIKTMRKTVIGLIPRLIYADPHSKLETLEDAFDVSLKAIIQRVARLRQDMIDGRTSSDLIEEFSWKYALLEQGDRDGVRRWDPFLHQTILKNAEKDYSGKEKKQQT